MQTPCSNSLTDKRNVPAAMINVSVRQHVRVDFNRVYPLAASLASHDLSER